MTPTRTPLLILLLLSTALGTGGVLLVRAGRGAVSQAEQFTSWRTTTAKLTEVDIAFTATLKHQLYSASPRYAYVVDGRAYTGRGMLGPAESADLDALKERLTGWFGAPVVTISHIENPFAYELRYKPAIEDITIRIDPADPAQSFAGTPSSEPATAAGTMSFFGWILVAIGGGGLWVTAAIWRGDRRDEALRRRHEAEASAGLPAPSAADETELARRIDAASAAIADAMRHGQYDDLAFALRELREMRAAPARTLLVFERLGMTRFLSGERGIEMRGDAGRRILDAVELVEAFHRQWRERGRR